MYFEIKLATFVLSATPEFLYALDFKKPVFDPITNNVLCKERRGRYAFQTRGMIRCFLKERQRSRLISNMDCKEVKSTVDVIPVDDTVEEPC